MTCHDTPLRPFGPPPPRWGRKVLRETFSPLRAEPKLLRAIADTSGCVWSAFVFPLLSQPRMGNSSSRRPSARLPRWKSGFSARQERDGPGSAVDVAP